MAKIETILTQSKCLSSCYDQDHSTVCLDCKAAYPIPIPAKNTPTAIPIRIP